VAPEALVERAHEAFANNKFEEAYDLWNQADRQGSLAPPDLERFAEAAFWTARGSETIAIRERAFAGHITAGDNRRAGGVALELVHDHAKLLNDATASGWLSRAKRLLSDEPEGVEHGYMARLQSQMAMIARDYAEAERQATLTVEIGTRLGDPNVLAMGLMQKGAALIYQGNVEDGMSCLDEAMVAVAGGELDVYTTAVIYCNAISTSRDLTDYRRAGEWTDAAKRWCSRESLSGFSGNCRVYRAEIIRLRGAFSEAETEAMTAVESVQAWDLTVAAGGLYEIGEVKLRLGELDEAEDYFRRAHAWGKDPQPGLALLWLARGKADAAAASVRRALIEVPHDRLARARLLPAQVEIAVASGDLATAERATAELGAIADDFGTALLRASSECARGLVDLLSGEPAAALQHLREALRSWQEVDAPYEAARCRLILAEAYDANGFADDASLEREAAMTALFGLGVPASAVAQVRIKPAGKASQAREGRAFMFTDIVKSTDLLNAIGDEAWNDLLAWHDVTLRGLFAEYSGEEVKHAGDGFFLAFPDVESGVRCAAAIQKRLAEHRRAAGFAPRVRIGLHFAEATSRAGDYFGMGVNQAARIGGVADGGEILISESSVTGLDLPVAEVREVNLKGISDPVRVASLNWQEL
jgi:class 3 adenylate cyclase